MSLSLSLQDDDLKKLGENIADSLGLDTVFDAFEEEEREVRQPRLPGFEDLNNEQLFFLTFAKVSFNLYYLL